MRESRILCILKETKGYALPSILFVILCVSVIILSVLWLKYFQHNRALDELASVKAEYAAQDGIAYSLLQLNTPQEKTNTFPNIPKKITLPGGVSTIVETMHWGLFWRVKSVGHFANATSMRHALLADTPSQQFNHALIFAQPSYQLVLAGSSFIRGHLLVGQSGVATGQLKDYATPRRLPVDGVVKKNNPIFPLFRPPHLDAQIEEYKKTLYVVDSAIDNGDKIVTAASNRDGAVIINSILDSIGFVRIKGDAIINAHIMKFEMSLSIAVVGNVLIDNEAQISGFVQIFSTGKITVAPNAKIENAILFSASSIQIQGQASLSGQLIAPVIVLEEGASLRYPSIVLSVPSEKPAPLKQNITISDKAAVEGLVALLSPNGGPAPQDGLVILKRTATIIGALYSENSMTLDGTVQGTVITRSFYFYEAPTTYFGWLRSGTIDRRGLPKGFLVPPGFSGQSRLQVLEWL